MSSLPLSVLLVDDSPDFRAAALLFLSQQPGLCVAATVASGEQALEISRGVVVDLVLMDLSMPGIGGLAATRQLKSAAKAPKIIVVTLENAPAYQEAAHAAGADGFVTKAEFSARLLPLISSLFPDRSPRHAT